MRSQNEMYVVINDNYTATVRCLRAFKAHLFNNTHETFDNNFGEVTYKHDKTNPRFERIVRKLIEMKKSALAKGEISKRKVNVLEKIGTDGYVWRNQGDRFYKVVTACETTNSYIMEYVMPKGTTSLILIDEEGNSNNFTYKQLSNSPRFRKNLKLNLLRNNPQSGLKFK